MPGVIIVGAQWGDEGKGKIIDLLSSQAQHVVRAQGGNNAGHTVIIKDEEYKLHLIPSGILHPNTQCYIGAGTVIDPEVLILELKALQSRRIEIEGRLWISPLAHVIFPYHRKLDILLEKMKGERSVGTTGRGIGPCYADKINRLGIRIGELIREDIFPKLLKNVLEIKNLELTKLFEVESMGYDEIKSQYLHYSDIIKPFVADVEDIIGEKINKSENILFEGAQGTFLDVTTGTYPYVTSSNTVAAGICVGSGIGLKYIDHVIGVVKAYTTRVGNGPLPSKMEIDHFDHYKAREYGTTTMRKRRIGWFDAVLVKTAVRINGLHSMALTKLDILDELDEIKICIAYELNGKKLDSLPSLSEDIEKLIPIYETHPGWKTTTSKITDYNQLPENAKHYLKRIEELCGIPISIVSIGPERRSTIILQELFFRQEVTQ